MRVKHVDISTVLSSKSKQVATVGAAGAVAAAVAALADRDVGLLVVVDDAGDMRGVVSERDIVRALAGRGAEVLAEPVSAIAVTDVLACRADAHPHDVLIQMYTHNIRHVPVVEDGKVRALVSSRDIIGYLARTTSADEQAMMWARLFGLEPERRDATA